MFNLSIGKSDKIRNESKQLTNDNLGVALIIINNRRKNLIHLLNDIENFFPYCLFDITVLRNKNITDTVTEYDIEPTNMINNKLKVVYTNDHIHTIIDKVKSCAGQQILIVNGMNVIDYATFLQENLDNQLREISINSDCVLVGINKQDPMYSKCQNDIRRNTDFSKDVIFYAFNSHILDGFDNGDRASKTLLDILMENGGIEKKLPYISNAGNVSNTGLNQTNIFHYIMEIAYLYLHGQNHSHFKQVGNSRLTKFLSRAARYYTVGAIGLFINFTISILLNNVFNDQYGYLNATIAGIIVSLHSNFLMNKIWTFEDKDFALRRLSSQYGKFITICLLGTFLQISLVFVFVEISNFQYSMSLILSIIMSSIGNFILNKRISFGQKIWG